MKTRLLKVISLICALFMLVGVFSACGGGEEDLSGEVIIQYVDAEGNPIDPDSIGNKDDKTDNDADKDADKDTDKDADKDQATSGISGATDGGKGNGKGQSTSKGKTTFASDPYSDIPSDLKGTTVDVLLWRQPDKIDTALKEAFEKKTGIKVNLISTVNNTAQYQTKLATLISAGDSPDVVMMGSATFPSYAIASLEPLDEEIFRLDDPIWNKSIMDAYKIGSKYYGLAVAGSWYCDDCSYLTYYYPEKLKGMGIQTMPYELWKAGKWNIDAVESIMRAVKQVNANYIGLSIQKNTSFNPYMNAAGVDYVKYNGKEFSSNLSNATVLEYNQKMAQWHVDNLVSDWEATRLGEGTVGLMDCIAYGVYMDANYFGVPASKIEVVPIAGTHVPANPKVWCVPKGAKNAKAAAYFLRYFLDPASFKDTTYKDIKNTFGTAQMYEVWQYITKQSTPKTINYAQGALSYYDTSAFGQFTGKIATAAPAQLNTVLSEYDRTMKAACSRCNKYLSRAQTKPSYTK